MKKVLALLIVCAASLAHAGTLDSANTNNGACNEPCSSIQRFYSGAQVNEFFLVSVGWAGQANSISSILDNVGNTYHPIGAARNVGTVVKTQLYYFVNTSTGLSTTTITLSGASTTGWFDGMFIQVAAMTGIDPYNPIDSATLETASGSGTSYSITSGPLSYTNEMMWGAFMEDNTSSPYTAGGGYTDVGPNEAVSLTMYNNLTGDQGTTQTLTATAEGSSNWSGLVIGLKNVTVAACDGAGNCYIRAGASGTGTGASWTNAYTGFGTGTGQVNPASMTRGATYWIATGTYSGSNPTFSTADSGTTPITIEGVTATSNGEAPDWNSSYAGQAEFAEMTINTDYWTFNGQAVSGCTYPSNNDSCYTIKFWNQTDTTGNIVALGGGITTLNLEYLELVGTGLTGGAFPNNSTADRCSTDNCGSVSDIGINETTSPVSDIYFGYSYIHHIGTNMFLFNVTGTGTSVNQNVTWDHDWFAYNHTGQNGWHTEAGSMYVSNFTVKYTVLQDISGSGEISTAGASTPAMSNWDIYGNIFFWDSTYAALAGQYHEATIDDGVIDFLGEQMSGYIHFYNNTLAGFNNSLVTTEGAPFSTLAVDANSGYSTCGTSCPTVLIYNNLWWDSAEITGDYTSYCQVVTSATCTQDYDAFYNGTVPSGYLAQPTETHGYLVTSTTATPFTNFSASTLAGFGLVTPDPFTSYSGLTIASPYNEDMLGVTRGADGIWDRGALQLFSSGALSAVTGLMAAVHKPN